MQVWRKIKSSESHFLCVAKQHKIKPNEAKRENLALIESKF
ncbi:hypothetical protein HFN_2364 [Helicobacter fennelliae MRY12-0050]|uniref:Uncharacterized protein n=1 Tax=Helicobacter fennelliae MRY12-0050 TaxID=1325130 RepID=T1CZT7_9HELI|nr:hypothetical protein HFN_2364 [Helicobacter fennelliae MRY12-0050]